MVVHSGDRPDVCVRRSIDSVWGMDAVHLQMARMDEGLVEMATGDHLSPRVIRLQGWSYVFIGEASLVLTILLLFLPAMLGGPTLQLRVIVGVVLSISVLLLICGVVPYVRSVMLSYHS